MWRVGYEVVGAGRSAVKNRGRRSKDEGYRSGWMNGRKETEKRGIQYWRK